MKVYVLLNEWSYDYEQDQQVTVFEKKSDAITKMKEGYEDFVKTEFEEDGRFNERGISELSAYVCEKGGWARNHCAWTIFESEVY